MATLHVWPENEQGQQHRWNWSLSASGLVGQHSTLGYHTVEQAMANARWAGIEWDQVDIHRMTSAQERAAGEVLLWEHEHGAKA